MTPKDYVYLSLIALSAIVFYWTGFYGGFSSTIRILRKEEEGQGGHLGDLALGQSAPTTLVVPMNHEESDATTVPGARSTRPVEHATAKSVSSMQPQSVYFGRN